MKIKLDENLGSEADEILAHAGHDVETVASQGLKGRHDAVIYFVCRAEGRCLVTLDRDFLDVARYPPEQISGIAVLRPRRTLTWSLIAILIEDLIRELEIRPIAGQLWIIEPGRIRTIRLPGNGRF